MPVKTFINILFILAPDVWVLNYLCPETDFFSYEHDKGDPKMAWPVYKVAHRNSLGLNEA